MNTNRKERKHENGYAVEKRPPGRGTHDRRSRAPRQNIRALQIKNAVLTLTGSLKNAQVRKEAEQLASKVPNVRQVVNQLEVRP